MIGLEQWRAAVGAWHAGSLRAYRHYVNGKRSIVRNWQTLLLCRGAASVQYSICWIIAVLFAFVSEGVASALGFNADCQSLCTSVKSPGKVCQDSLQYLQMISSTFAATVRSGAVDLCRLVKSTSPSLASMLRLLIALHWLLIVAGDVELNPGPVSQEIKELLSQVDDSELGEGDILDVFEEVVSLAGRWPSICIVLRLLPSDRDTIARDCRDVPRDCLMEVLIKWLQRCYDTTRYGPPTWRMLVAAVANSVGGDNPGLAREIARNHPGTTQTVPLRATLSTDPSSTVVSLHAQYLRGSYQTQIPTFLTLQWPPPPTYKIFNLAMIQGKNIRFGPIDEEMVRLILRGKVKDILYEKKPVELKDIFRLDNAKRKVVLIEGAPGSGKSTLAWHVCQTWESGKLFQNYQTVVYVQLRDPMIQLARSIEDLIPAESRDQAEKVMEEFRTCRGENLLFVLDGWDELPSYLHTNSIFHQLIVSPEILNLNFSAVIITSRPIASSDLYRSISSRIEILGFTPTEVQDYFTEALGGEVQAVQKLQDQLEECPMVKACCYLPLNAAIVSHLFLADNYSLPTTLHGVFTMLVLCCLKRHVAKQEGERGKQHITSLDNLPSDIELLFKDVYKLAYHGVMDNKATFPMEYLKSHGLPKISETLGLLQGVESVTRLDDSSPSYYFLHLSVQELLAAFYISKLPGKEQVVVFNKLFGEPRFTAVFRFYTTFTKLDNEGIRRIVVNIIKKKDKYQILYLLHGLYEAQTLSLCEFVGFQLGRKLDLSYTTLSPFDCLAVGYFISCFSGEFTVMLVECSLDSYRVRYLCKELAKSTSSISMRTPDSAAKDAGVSSCLELNLNLSGNSVGDEGAAFLCGGNANHLLKTLHLGRNGLSDNGASAIAEALKVNGSLTELHLGGNGLSHNGASAIAEALKVNNRLIKLDLSDNQISDEGGSLRCSSESQQQPDNTTDVASIGTVDGTILKPQGIEEEIDYEEVPKIKQQPSNLDNVTLGEDVEFVVEADGKDLSYKWHHKTTGQTREVGDNNPTLRIDDVKSDDEGDYTCTISNPTDGAVKTNPARLTTIPQITEEPDSMDNVTPGEPAEFVVKAIGKNLTYTWYRQTGKQLLPNDERVVVGKTQILCIDEVESKDEGYYVCTISNPTGGYVETSPAQLTTRIKEEDINYEVVQIKQQPSNLDNMTPGEDVEFVVEADGKDLSYKWHHTTAGRTSEVGENNPTLHIHNVKSDDEGDYTCTISNPTGGTVKTNPARLTTIPQITEEPNSMKNVTPGEPAEFVVKAVGKNLTYTWHRQTGKLLLPNEERVVVGNTQIFCIDEVELKDEGYYVCTISNPTGGTVETSPAQLTTRRKQEDIDEEDKRLFEEAMKDGFINAQVLKVIFTGAGGVGKTHALCLLRGVAPPDPNYRESTDCANKAVTLRVDAANDEKWEEIDLEKRKKKTAEGICAAERAKEKKEQQPVPTPSPQEPLIPQPQPEPESKPERKAEPQSPEPKPEQKAEPQSPKPKPDSNAQPQSPEPKPERKAESQPVDPKPQFISTLVSSQALETESDLLKRIHELKSGEVCEKGIKWVYAVDTGGQPPFHELLSAFIKGASVCAFVFKLSERLDHRPQVELWWNGETVGRSFEHPLNNRQILEQSIQTIQALPSLSDEHSKSPLLLVIGTHRDQQNECRGETLEDKEKELQEIVKKSGCDCVDSGEKKIIFNVNAKNPKKRDKAMARVLRRKIAERMPMPEPIPLRYYGLELELEHLATKQGVVSMEECRKIGMRLNFDDREGLNLKAALRFLHRLNVLLYYPEVKEVEELIFCDPLFLIKIVSEVVAHIYQTKHQYEGATTKWKDSCERGLITIEQLETDDFHRYFLTNIFTPNHLFRLFEHLLIVAKINEGDQQFFMPCLLDDLKTAEIARPECVDYSPLVFQFLKSGYSVYAPTGLFSALVAFLLSEPCSWTIKDAANGGVKLHRNIITFHSSSPSADITLINFLTTFEVFATCSLDYLQAVRNIIVSGLEKVMEVRNFKYVKYNEAFTCKCPKQIRHLAEINFGEKTWCCPDDPKIRGHLENTELVWREAIPQITRQPGNLDNVTPGEDVEFVVEADGKDLSYKWYHKTAKRTSEVGGNDPALHIDNVKSADEGDYVCTISNPTGGTVKTDPARLTTRISFWNKYRRLLYIITAIVVLVIAVLIAIGGPSVLLQWLNNTALSSQTAGQMEATPGPGDPGCTVIDDYKKAIQAIENDISDWRRLGEELGIKSTELDRVNIDWHVYGEQRKLRETIHVWQKRVPEDRFCWEKLINALKAMQEIRLAKSLSEKYNIKWKQSS